MVTNQRKSTNKLPPIFFFFFFFKELAFSNFALSRNNSLCQAVRRDQTKNLQLRVLLQNGQWMLFLVQNCSLGLVTAKWDLTVENCTTKNHRWPNSFPLPRLVLFFRWHKHGCPFDDTSMDLSCPVSKRWCVPHGQAGTLLIVRVHTVPFSIGVDITVRT